MNKRILTGAFAILIAVSPMTAHAESFQIKGKSMLPTYKEGDIVDIKHTKEYKDGDIVIAELKNGKKVIKRLQGDMLEGDNKKGSINIPLTEVKEIIGKPVENTDDLTDKDIKSFEELFADGIKELKLGGEHSAVLTQSGSLYLWGNNDFGQIGTGTNSATIVTPLKVMDDVKNVTLASAHTLAVLNNGEAYSWGFNSDYQLGLGHTTVTPTPTKIPNLEGLDISKVFTGPNNSAVLTKTGDVYAWGNNYNLQLGLGTSSQSYVIKPIKVASNIKKVSIHSYNLMLLTNAGELKVAGSNSEGVIGNGVKSDTDVSVFYTVRTGVLDADLGLNHAGLVTNTGEVYTWGSSQMWQLGQGGSGTSFNKPTLVNFTQKVKKITLGDNSTFVVFENGELYGWGDNVSGQVGNGGTTSVRTPTKISSNIESVVAKGASSGAMSRGGEIFTWGSNNKSQTGNGSSDTRTYPTKISTDFAFSNEVISNIISGVVYLPVGSPVLPNYQDITSDKGEIFVRNLNGYRISLAVIRYTPPTTIGNLNIK